MELEPKSVSSYARGGFDLSDPSDPLIRPLFYPSDRSVRDPSRDVSSIRFLRRVVKNGHSGVSNLDISDGSDGCLELWSDLTEITFDA